MFYHLLDILSPWLPPLEKKHPCDRPIRIRNASRDGIRMYPLGFCLFRYLIGGSVLWQLPVSSHWNILPQYCLMCLWWAVNQFSPKLCTHGFSPTQGLDPLVETRGRPAKPRRRSSSLQNHEIPKWEKEEKKTKQLWLIPIEILFASGRN